LLSGAFSRVNVVSKTVRLSGSRWFGFSRFSCSLCLVMLVLGLKSGVRWSVCRRSCGFCLSVCWCGPVFVGVGSSGGRRCRAPLWGPEEVVVL